MFKSSCFPIFVRRDRGAFVIAKYSHIGPSVNGTFAKKKCIIMVHNTEKQILQILKDNESTVSNDMG